MSEPSRLANNTVASSITINVGASRHAAVTTSINKRLCQHQSIQTTNRRYTTDTVNNGVAWKTPSCICSCQWCIKCEVFCSNCWMLQRWLEAEMGCRRGPQYDGKCSFYLNCYFFRTSPINRDLREKAVYFPPRWGGLLIRTDADLIN